MASDFYQNSNKLLIKLKNKSDNYQELKNVLSVFKSNIDIWINKINQNEENDNVNIHSQDIK